jgi:hypothetical protein
MHLFAKAPCAGKARDMHSERRVCSSLLAEAEIAFLHAAARFSKQGSHCHAHTGNDKQRQQQRRCCGRLPPAVILGHALQQPHVC